MLIIFIKVCYYSKFYLIRREKRDKLDFKRKITKALHVSKPRKAIFLSAIHHSGEIIIENDEKTISAINKYYNEIKSDVDTLDQMVHE